MLKNATYNLLESASVISKGLYRYDTFIQDAADCQDCQEIWNRMARGDASTGGLSSPSGSSDPYVHSQ